LNIRQQIDLRSHLLKIALVFGCDLVIPLAMGLQASSMLQLQAKLLGRLVQLQILKGGFEGSASDRGDRYSNMAT
jgi:hypothetical protein